MKHINMKRIPFKVTCSGFITSNKARIMIGQYRYLTYNTWQDAFAGHRRNPVKKCAPIKLRNQQIGFYCQFIDNDASPPEGSLPILTIVSGAKALCTTISATTFSPNLPINLPSLSDSRKPSNKKRNICVRIATANFFL